MSTSSYRVFRHLERLRQRRKSFPRVTARRSVRGFETLEGRRVLAIMSSFSGGVLTIKMDGADNVAISSVAGLVKINGLDPSFGSLQRPRLAR